MIAPVDQFREDATRVAHDDEHRRRIQGALGKYYIARDQQVGRYQDWHAARQAAGEIKWEAVNHLDRYLEEFATKLEARGGKVFWANNSAEAREYILCPVDAGIGEVVVAERFVGADRVDRVGHMLPIIHQRTKPSSQEVMS
ncbi:MAG: hypothetical protein ABIZ56_02785 [Chthoniobacteraceae bacterium]